MIVIDAKDMSGPAFRELLDRVAERAASSDRPRFKSVETAPRAFDLDELDRIRAMTPPGPQEDSVAILRVMRYG